MYRVKNRSKKGSVLAEFALLIPVMILLFGSFFEIGRINYIQNILSYSAKEAARVGTAIKESVNGGFTSYTTISRTEIETLIKSSIRVDGILEEDGQFAISYLDSYGNSVTPVEDLPFDRSNDPFAVHYIEVTVTYPGMGANVSAPIPLIFNPGNVFGTSTVTLTAMAVYEIEGRFEG